MDPYEEWEKKLADFIKEQEKMRGWRDRIAKDPSDHVLKDMGKIIEEWKIRNPPPPKPIPPKPPKTSKPPIKKIQQTVDITDDIRKQQWLARNFRRGKRGVTTIGTIASIPSGGLAAVGTAVLCYLAEEAAMQALGYAYDIFTAPPTSQAEATAKYHAYVRGRQTVQQECPSFNVPILNKDQYLLEYHGLQLEELR